MFFNFSQKFLDWNWKGYLKKWRRVKFIKFAELSSKSYVNSKMYKFKNTNFEFFSYTRILTSAIVSDIGFRAETSPLMIANRVSGTIVVGVTGNYTNALDVRIGIRYRSFGTGASVSAVSIRAGCTVATNFRFCALVDI